MKMVMNARGKRSNVRWNGLDAIMWDPLGMVRMGDGVDRLHPHERERARRSFQYQWRRSPKLSPPQVVLVAGATTAVTPFVPARRGALVPRVVRPVHDLQPRVMRPAWKPGML
jgi:hypothetical protein